MLKSSYVNDVDIHRAYITGCNYVVDFYVSQPAPMQWVAVGVMVERTSDGFTSRFPSLFVGTGRTEEAAIVALAERLVSLSCGEDTSP